MLETSARLLRLLSLLQARRFWSGPDLATRLEITDRTLRRDIDRLRSLGYPVQATAGVAGGYQLSAGSDLPPLLLEDDEALAVSVALRTADHHVAGIEEAAMRALVKLERVTPTRLRRRADALRAAIVQLGRNEPTVASEALVTLASACQDHRQAEFEYTTRGARTNQRQVEPIGLVHTGYRWYLVGWDVNRDDWRTFRLDRITGDVVLGAPFTPRSPPEGGDLRKYVSRSVSVEVYQRRARIVLFAPLEVVAARISPAAGVLERLDEDRCSLSTGAESFISLAIYLGMQGIDFEVEDPPDLLETLRELHERLGRTLARSR